MPYGLKDIELEKLSKVFAANERIERVVLYGSRAKGNYKPFSDVDITLEGDELTHTDLSRLSLAIDDLLLPYQFDISIFHTMKNEALIDHIRRMGITIYEKKSEWKEIKLGDCVEAIIDNRGKSAPTKQTGEYPLLEINSIGGYYPNYGVVRKYVDETTFKTWFRSGHPASGDILIPTVGTIGILSIMDNKKACIAQNIIALRINKDVSNVFIYYYLKSPIVKQELLNLDIGGVQPSIKVPHLLDLSISLPPKEVQVNIASVLSSLDDKIDLLHRENATLEQMAETLFRQWFVEEAKEDWEEGTVADLVEFNPTRKLVKGTIAPFLEMSNLSTSTYAPTYWYNRAFSSGSKFQNGDTLLARITPCLENGKTAYVDFLNENQVGWGSTEFIVMHSKLGIHSFFSYVIAKYQDFRDYAESCMSGSSGRQRVDVDNLKNYPINIPDKTAIAYFNSEIDTMVSKMNNNNKQIQTLIQTRDGLLPRLMSGEVKI